MNPDPGIPHTEDAESTEWRGEKGRMHRDRNMQLCFLFSLHVLRELHVTKAFFVLNRVQLRVENLGDSW